MIRINSIRQIPTVKPNDGVYYGVHDGSHVEFDTPQGKFRGETESRDSIWGVKHVKVTVKDSHATMEYVESRRACCYCGQYCDEHTELDGHTAKAM